MTWCILKSGWRIRVIKVNHITLWTRNSRRRKKQKILDHFPFYWHYSDLIKKLFERFDTTWRKASNLFKSVQIRKFFTRQFHTGSYFVTTFRRWKLVLPQKSKDHILAITYKLGIMRFWRNLDLEGPSC